ncbi:MAG TPA: FAD-dependent oxidoreductase [Leptolyngbyaceae cyanobacterium]
MDFDYIVVGRGLMGSAAAQHLAAAGAYVGLIGPAEPCDNQGRLDGSCRAAHSGVFASHYDEGRITRAIDPSHYWALFAQRAIARYRPLEALSGIFFYGEVGHLAVGQDHGDSRNYLKALQQVAKDLGVGVVVLNREALQQHFPYFRFYENAVGVWQPQDAGYISPRAHVLAQTQAVERLGGEIIAQEVMSVRSQDGIVRVTTTEASYCSRGVIIATGGFTHARSVLPQRLQLTIKAHTVLLAEVNKAHLASLQQMPSLISKPCDPNAHFYLLPPIRYPDGKWYIKIGCSQTPPISDDLATLQAWFKSDGDSAVVDHLKRLLEQTLPDLEFSSYWVDTCVTTHTPTGYPYIDWVTGEGQEVVSQEAARCDRILTLVGGNGYAGKSADELGWIAAGLVQAGRWTYDLEAELFKVQYAP